MLATDDLIPFAIIGAPVVVFALVLAVGNAIHEYPWRRNRTKESS